MVKSEITINKDKKQFQLPLNNETAILEFKWHHKDMVLVHTFVPESFRGQGIADRLAKFALDYIRSENIKAIVYCPFVKKYLERHPEYMDIVLEIH